MDGIDMDIEGGTGATILYLSKSYENLWTTIQK